MFENYTEIAKQTIVIAKAEAAQLGAAEIGVEHILLALLRDEDVVTRLLQGVSISEIREDIMARTLRGPELEGLVGYARRNFLVPIRLAQPLSPNSL